MIPKWEEISGESVEGETWKLTAWVSESAFLQFSVYSQIPAQFTPKHQEPFKNVATANLVKGNNTNSMA